MQRSQHFYFIGIMEPFQNRQYIEEYKKKLGMKHDMVNVSGKIWEFKDENMEFSIVK